MIDFHNLTHSDLIDAKYGIVSPKRPDFIFAKLSGADGPFRNSRNGLNKPIATMRES